VNSVPEHPKDTRKALLTERFGAASVGKIGDCLLVTKELTGAAARVGARDVFVFRRVQAARFVHVGGLGRGEGWAGIVELALDVDAAGHAARAAKLGQPVRVAGDRAERMFGPYFGRAALFVPVSPDLIVVFADPERLLEPVSDSEAIDLAQQAANCLEFTSPAKRLADELELLHAVRDMMAYEAAELDVTARHIVERAATALSCEIGVLHLTGIETPRTALVERGAAIVDRSAVERAMKDLVSGPGAGPLPRCEQDARLAPLPAPFRFENGVRSYYLLEVGRPRLGLLLLLHMETCPRGFTLLCQDLGARLAEAAESLMRTALARMHLQGQIDRVFREARIDSLTGVGNRLAWREALGAERAGAAILVVDLDNLKKVNDQQGHEAGDEHLRAASNILREAAGPSAVVARIGGDEFAVLLADGDRASVVVDALNTALARSMPVAGWPVSFALGMAVAEPGEAMDSVQKRADAAMYAVKRCRRAAALQRSVTAS
jgi:diguanylate cyclase (GGDEF)-like protein